MSKTITLNSISQVHQALGLAKPRHPLVTVIQSGEIKNTADFQDVKVVLNLYRIALKQGLRGTLKYGRNSYDYQEGTLIFTAPGQVMEYESDPDADSDNYEGWTLGFHPDLIRNTSLGKTIGTYRFFEYDVHEALHLSDDEKKTINDLVQLIRNEIAERIDNHSQKVISSYLELLLNLSKRYYERQFNTRSAKNSDILSQFQSLLKDYYESENFSKQGIPSIEYFSERVNLSANYLSDVLKKETGYSAKDQINNFIIEKAKTLLLSESDSVSGIAFTLGFNYPHYFSRLFKNKTGLTPQEYRQMN